MKRTLLILSIASTLILAGCDDKETLTKLQNAQQSITQLKAELEQQKSVLEKQQSELKNSQLELEKTQTGTPTVFAKPISLFKQRESFSRDSKGLDEFELTESYISYEINTVDTGIDWLDELLYKGLISEIELEDKKKEQEILALPTAKAQYLALTKHSYENELQMAKQFETRASTQNTIVNYMGQRENIVSFNVFSDVYTGGAHNMYWTDYINIDAKKKSVIKLDDLFPQNQADVQQLLWDSYASRNIDEQGKPVEPFTNKKDFFISDQFYFSMEGINFVYPPYAIGPFAEGEITLTLYWQQLDNLVNPDYKWNLSFPTQEYE